MSHTGVHKKTVTMGNGAVTFHAHCADDPDQHISVHTCYVEKQFGVMKTEEEIDQELQSHLTRVEQLHMARQFAENIHKKYQETSK